MPIEGCFGRPVEKRLTTISVAARKQPERTMRGDHMHTQRSKRVTMVTYILTAALFMAAPQASSDEQIDTEDPDVKSVLAVEKRLLDLMLDGDVEAFGELISPQFVASDPSNTIRRRDELIALVASGRLKYESFDTSIDFAEKVADDLVVIMGNETTRQSAVPVEGALAVKALADSLSRRFTNVYRKEQGEWRLLIKQSTIIAAE